MGDVGFMPGESRQAKGLPLQPQIGAGPEGDLMRIKAARQRQKLALREEKGFRKAVEELIPGVLARMEERQLLMDQVGIGLLEAVAAKDWAAVSTLAKLTKDSYDEDKRLLDRARGTAVARSQAEVTQTVIHKNLRDLVADAQFIEAELVEETTDEA